MTAHPIDERREPTRTCVGCRAEDAQGALLRFVVGDPESSDPTAGLVPDVRGRLPGRGINVHPKRACVEKAALKGGIARALKRNVRPDPDALCALAVHQYERRTHGLISSAVRSRRAAVGTDAVRDAMRSGELALLVVANDAAGRREELIAGADRLGARAVLLADKVTLGGLCGRAEVGVIAILDLGIAAEVAAAAASAMRLVEKESGAGPMPGRSDARGTAAGRNG